MIFGSTNPVIGERRERVLFAWLPICLDDGTYAWLTRVRVVEVGRAVHLPGQGYRPARPGERGYWHLTSAILP